jgi:hypothetical protein
MPWAIAQGRVILAAVAFATGDQDTAVAELRRAIGRFDSTGMALHAAAARRRLGAVLQGDEGQALITEAEAGMARAGVANVDGVVRMLAPGFAPG